MDVLSNCDWGDYVVGGSLAALPRNVPQARLGVLQAARDKTMATTNIRANNFFMFLPPCIIVYNCIVIDYIQFI